MNLATTLEMYALGGEKRSLFQIGDAVTFDRIGPDGHGHGTYIGRVVDLLDNGQAQVRFSFPNGQSAVHMTQTVSIHKLRRAPMEAIGEPNAGTSWYSHISPVPSFHPPSDKKKTPVPTDDPMEKSDRFLDVTKQKDKDTQKFKLSLNRRMQQPPNMGPKGMGPGAVAGVQPHTAGMAMFGSKKK